MSLQKMLSDLRKASLYCFKKYSFKFALLTIILSVLCFDQIHYNIVYVSSTSLLTHNTSSLPRQAIPVTLSIHTSSLHIHLQ